MRDTGVAYALGNQAYYEGVKRCMCPYDDEPRSSEWEAGWDDAAVYDAGVRAAAGDTEQGQ